MYFYVIKLQKENKTYQSIGTVPIFNRKINTPNTHTDRSRSWLGTGSSIKKYGGV